MKYNQRLKEKYNREDVVDPISLEDIDESNEWLIGKMGAHLEDAENELVFDDDELTQDTITSATRLKNQ